MHQPIYFHTTQAIHFKQFPYHTNARFWSNSHKPETVFTVPKQSKWDVCGQPTHPTSVLLCETKFHGHSWSHTYQNTIYCIIMTQGTQTVHTLSRTVQMGSKKFHISVPSFGTDQTATLGLQSTQASQNT